MSHAAFARFGRIVIWFLAIACVVHLYRLGLRIYYYGDLFAGHNPLEMLDKEHELLSQALPWLGIDAAALVFLPIFSFISLAQISGALMVPWWAARATRFIGMTDPILF